MAIALLEPCAVKAAGKCFGNGISEGHGSTCGDVGVKGGPTIHVRSGLDNDV